MPDHYLPCQVSMPHHPPLARLSTHAHCPPAASAPSPQPRPSPRPASPARTATSQSPLGGPHANAEAQAQRDQQPLRARSSTYATPRLDFQGPLLFPVGDTGPIHLLETRQCLRAGRRGYTPTRRNPGGAAQEDGNSRRGRPAVDAVDGVHLGSGLSGLTFLLATMKQSCQTNVKYQDLCFLISLK